MVQPFQRAKVEALNFRALKQKTFTPGKTENEGIHRTLPRTRAAGWPHPSLDGEVGPAWRDLDEHSRTDILTSGLNLAPAFPAASASSGCGSL
jgi:hypothetical protein